MNCDVKMLSEEQYESLARKAVANARKEMEEKKQIKDSQKNYHVESENDDEVPVFHKKDVTEYYEDVNNMDLSQLIAAELETPLMSDDEEDDMSFPKMLMYNETSRKSPPISHPSKVASAVKVHKSHGKKLKTLHPPKIKKAKYSNSSFKTPSHPHHRTCSLTPEDVKQKNQDTEKIIKRPKEKLQCMQTVFMEREIPERGVWVQCTRTGCKKWRYLADVTDPSTIAELWSCEQNSDATSNSCDKPEADWKRVEQQQGFVDTKFTIGSIVWAKLDGYPWWPAMVEEDPNVGEYFWLVEEWQTTPTDYHVVFLDKNITRAWVNRSSIKIFSNPKQHLGLVKVKGKLLSQLEEAKIAAVRAIGLSIKERITQYGFSSHYTGKWGGADQSLAEEFQSSWPGHGKEGAVIQEDEDAMFNPCEKGVGRVAQESVLPTEKQRKRKHDKNTDLKTKKSRKEISGINHKGSDKYAKKSTISKPNEVENQKDGTPVMETTVYSKTDVYTDENDNDKEKKHEESSGIIEPVEAKMKTNSEEMKRSDCEHVDANSNKTEDQKENVEENQEEEVEENVEESLKENVDEKQKEETDSGNEKNMDMTADDDTDVKNNGKEKGKKKTKKSKGTSGNTQPVEIDPMKEDKLKEKSTSEGMKEFNTVNNDDEKMEVVENQNNETSFVAIKVNDHDVEKDAKGKEKKKKKPRKQKDTGNTEPDLKKKEKSEGMKEPNTVNDVDENKENQKDVTKTNVDTDVKKDVKDKEKKKKRPRKPKDTGNTEQVEADLKKKEESEGMIEPNTVNDVNENKENQKDVTNLVTKTNVDIEANGHTDVEKDGKSKEKKKRKPRKPKDATENTEPVEKDPLKKEQVKAKRKAEEMTKPGKTAEGTKKPGKAAEREKKPQTLGTKGNINKMKESAKTTKLKPTFKAPRKKDTHTIANKPFKPPTMKDISNVIDSTLTKNTSCDEDKVKAIRDLKKDKDIPVENEDCTDNKGLHDDKFTPNESKAEDGDSSECQSDQHVVQSSDLKSSKEEQQKDLQDTNDADDKGGAPDVPPECDQKDDATDALPESDQKDDAPDILPKQTQDQLVPSNDNEMDYIEKETLDTISGIDLWDQPATGAIGKHDVDELDHDDSQPFEIEE